MIVTLDKRYKLPGRMYFTRTAIPTLYTEKRDIVTRHLKDANWYDFSILYPQIKRGGDDNNASYDTIKIFYFLSSMDKTQDFVHNFLTRDKLTVISGNVRHVLGVQHLPSYLWFGTQNISGHLWFTNIVSLTFHELQLLYLPWFV